METKTIIQNLVVGDKVRVDGPRGPLLATVMLTEKGGVRLKGANGKTDFIHSSATYLTFVKVG